MKQTSIEWFANQLGITSGTMLEQAKEMHKQEIIDAHYEGQCDNTEGYPKYLAQQYYQETFKKD